MPVVKNLTITGWDTGIPSDIGNPEELVNILSISTVEDPNGNYIMLSDGSGGEVGIIRVEDLATAVREIDLNMT